MKTKKHKRLLDQIYFIILGICIVFLVFAFAYVFTAINNCDEIVLGVGELYTMQPSQDDYVARSYNSNVIALHNDSTIIAKEKGNAVTCLKYNFFNRDFFRFSVIDAPKTLTLTKKNLMLSENEEATLSVADSQNNSFTVTYTSSDPSVASVDEKGNIKALKHGKCEIKASYYSDVYDVCTLDVVKAPTQFSLSDSSVVMGEEESFPLEPIFAKGEHSNAIKWVSSNPDVAVVEKNKIQPVNVGECSITATTHNGLSATCTVTVKATPKNVKLMIPDKFEVGTDIIVHTDITDDYYVSDENKKLSVSDEEILSIDEENNMLIHCKKKGKAKITLTLLNGVKAEKTVTVGDYNSSNIPFSIINQYPSLPTGCEVVSLTSVLNHYGFKVSATTMADKYMPKVNPVSFSVSPHDYFLGDPHTKDGMGCFSGCIIKTTHNYFNDIKSGDYIALDISGCSAKDLYNYILNDIPVITWVTSGFSGPTLDGSWELNGEIFNWYDMEHCLVTTGYNEKANTVTVADDAGGYSYTVSMSQFERVFEGTDAMAVVVLKK